MASLTTKYDLGQEVFYMKDNKCTSGIVGYIDTRLILRDGRPEERGNFKTEITYGLLAGYLVPSAASFDESSLFDSKENLLKTL